MPRFFTLEQARRLIPDVDAAIRDAVFLMSEFQQAESELLNARRQIVMMGGTLVDRDRLIAQKSRGETSAVKLNEAVEKIHSFGCQVKDLDLGLIDFPSLYRGKEVCLCWKLGETGIDYWHGVSEGFQGRKKIDQEFLDNHKGDLTH